MTHPPFSASKWGSRLPIHVFNSVCLGLVPGQMDSPYLIIMPWITIPRDEYYTIPGNQLFVPPRKYVRSLILRAIRVPHRQMRTVPGKAGHPSSWVKLSECLYEKKDDPVLAHALIVLTIPSLPGWVSQSCFMEKKVARLGGWHSVAALTFCFLCKRGLSSFVLRGCKKSWLAPDSFGRQEILLSETCVLHQYKRLLSTAEKRLLD